MRKQAWSGVAAQDTDSATAARHPEAPAGVAETEDLLRRVALLSMAASMSVSTALSVARALLA